MRKLSRRNVLRGAGAAGLSAMFLPSAGMVRAGTPDENKKLVFVYAEAGWTPRHYIMRPPWAPPEWSEYEIYDWRKNGRIPDNTEFEFDLTDSRLTENDFSRLLKPLYRHRDVMTATEGLAMLTTAHDPYGDAHAKAHIHAWSATPAASEDAVKSRGAVPSLDQRIHEHIRQTDPAHQTMDFRTIEPDFFHEWLYMSDGAGGAARLPTEVNPVAAFDRFFSNQMMQMADPLTSNASLTVDLAMAQYADLAPKLSAPDRAKLEQHLETLLTLERKLGRVPVSCDTISRPPDRQGMTNGERYPLDFDAFATMIAAGLSCGVSRVATLGMLTPMPELYGLPPSASIHHEYEHPTDPLLYYSGDAVPDYLDLEDAMARRNEYQLNLLADFIDILRATPDGDGNLLDSTLVVYLSELSHGNHGHENYPSLLFGTGGGIVTPGRYIKYKQNQPNPWGRNYHNEYTGVAHSQLLVSIAQGFGLPLDNFGHATADGEAPHTGDTATIQLGGPLPRLKV